MSRIASLSGSASIYSGNPAMPTPRPKVTGDGCVARWPAMRATFRSNVALFSTGRVRGEIDPCLTCPSRTMRARKSTAMLVITNRRPHHAYSAQGRGKNATDGRWRVTARQERARKHRICPGAALPTAFPWRLVSRLEMA